MCEAQPKTLDRFGLELVVAIPGTCEVLLRLFDRLDVEWAVRLDFIKECLRPHVVKTEPDMFEVLVQSALDCIEDVLLISSNKFLDDGIIAPLDV